jgi:hypothetical protein
VQYEPPAIVRRDRIEGVLAIVGSPVVVSASFRRASTASPEARDEQAGAR